MCLSADLPVLLFLNLGFTGNGPLIQMDIGLKTLRRTKITIQGFATSWMGMSQFELWSEQGLELEGSWLELAEGMEFTLPQRNQYCLVAWGIPTQHPFGDEHSWVVAIRD